MTECSIVCYLHSCQKGNRESARKTWQHQVRQTPLICHGYWICTMYYMYYVLGTMYYVVIILTLTWLLVSFVKNLFWVLNYLVPNLEKHKQTGVRIQ
jgi:hypothetical protein